MKLPVSVILNVVKNPVANLLSAVGKVLFNMLDSSSLAFLRMAGESNRHKAFKSTN